MCTVQYLHEWIQLYICNNKYATKETLYTYALGGMAHSEIRKSTKSNSERTPSVNIWYFKKRRQTTEVSI